MQIPHIQPMRESKLLCTTYGLVAFALAIGLLSVTASVRVTARTNAPARPAHGQCQRHRRRHHHGRRGAHPPRGHRCPRGGADLPAQMVRLVGVRDRGNCRPRQPDRQQARQLRSRAASTSMDARWPYASSTAATSTRRWCARATPGPSSNTRRATSEGGGRRQSGRPRHLAGRVDARVGVPRPAVGCSRAADARGLRHQRQRHPQRQDLSHALEPLVRTDQDGARQGQALVLHRNRSDCRGLATCAVASRGRMRPNGPRKQQLSMRPHGNRCYGRLDCRDGADHDQAEIEQHRGDDGAFDIGGPLRHGCL